MKNRICNLLGGCLVVFVLLFSIAHLNASQVKFTIQVEAEGTGNSRYNAILDALQQATMQAFGVKLVAEEELVNYAKEVSSNKDGVTKRTRVYDDEFKRNVIVSTKGQIVGYEVLSATQESPHLWRVAVNATVRKLNVQPSTSEGSSNAARRKLAVLPLQYTLGKYTFEGEPIDSASLSQRICQRIITDFTQSRRFAVVDLEYINAFMKEKNYSPSGKLSNVELIKIRQEIGVDYLIVGEIEEFSGKIITNKLAGSNRVVSYSQGGATISYRILADDGQIKWSSSVTIDLAQLEGANSTARLDNALNSIAWQVSLWSLDNIYPLKVVGVLPNVNEIIINRGGKMVPPGLILTAMGTSEALTDPDTGETLGYAESPVATVQVTRSDAKMSYARVTQGRLSDIKRNDIVRRRQSDAQTPTGTSGPAPTGVKLSFD